MTREQAQAAVSGWLERIDSSRDAALSLQPPAIEATGQLAGFLTGGEDVEVLLALGWMNWYWHLAADDEDSLHRAVLAFTPCFIADVGSWPEPVMPMLADAAAEAPEAALPRAAATVDLDTIHSIVALWRRILAWTPDDHPYRAGRLSGLGTVLRFCFQLSGAESELDEAIAANQEAVAACPVSHPERTAILGNLEIALYLRFSRSAARTDLDQAITALTEAVGIAPPDDPRRSKNLADLGGYLRIRFESSGDRADLEQAMTAGRDAVSSLSADQPDSCLVLANLAATLHTRTQRFGAAADLDETISLYRRALACAPPSDPNRAQMAWSLSHALLLRFERVGAATDLAAAIPSLRTAVSGTGVGDADRAARLSRLGATLHRWFEVSGEVTCLDEAVMASREAVSLTTPGDAALAERLDWLQSALRDRFDGAAAVADLEEAIGLLRAAVATPTNDEDDRAVPLSSLGSALLDRFGLTARSADLEEAVARHRAAVAAVTAESPRRAIFLANLAGSLQARFSYLGQGADSEEAIGLLREALGAIPANDYRRPKCLTNLGKALRDRFDRTAESADLEEAIALLREAAAAGPTAQPEGAVYLNNLGAALQTRYSRTGSTEDLEESVAVARQALAAITPGHPRRAWYQSNLGAVLQLRYRRTESAKDMDEGIALQRAAAAATPAGQPDRARYLYNLCIDLMARYRRTRSLDDLDEAVDLGRQAAAAAPAGHVERAGRLNQLGDALWNRFDRTASTADLDEAITVLRDAAAATPPGQAGRAAALTNLGVALRSRFRRPGGENPADVDEAIEALAEAAETARARPSERIRAARTAVALLVDRDVHRSAGLLELAVRLLPEVAPRELTSRDKQYQIGTDLDLGAGLAGDAAAFALADDGDGVARPTRALGLLELGRAVLLTQSLETRGDVGDLQAREPALARRFLELREALDQTQAGPGRHDLHQLATDFREVLRRIRAVPGFATFLQPPPADQLIRQADAGPIAVINVSQHRSDAILVRPQGIASIPLPGLGREALGGKVTAFYQFLRQASDGATAGKQRQAAQRSVGETLEWLWDVAAEPVLNELGYTEPPAEGAAWPRLWWAPGGLLGLLPIHAAGYHRDEGARARGRTVMDRVISSYTPTVRTLVYARERAARNSGSPLPALAVAMPVTPGLAPLAFAAQEVACVRSHIPQARVYIEKTAVTETTPTRERVLELMTGCALAHFACHGSNDLQDPSRSQLYLHDHADKPLTVAAISAIRLERAQLAYLSACGTALNRNPVLLDEAIHMTAAFQLAGFARVTGTLWPIDDMISASMADAFYSGLRASDGSIDVSRAAAALHQAQRTARDGLTAFPSLWAPYLHMGA
jgi:hypothetical protein